MERMQSTNTGKRLMITLLLMLFFGGGLGLLTYGLIANDTVTLPSHPRLVIESCWDVKIVTNTTSNTINVHKNFFSRPYRLREVEDNVFYIKGSGCWDIVVDVPVNTDLQIDATTSVEVTGVKGQMQLKGGSITLLDCTLQGRSQLDGSGNLIFRGSFAKDSEIKMGSSQLMDLQVPRDASFTLESTGSLSSLTTNFTEIQIPPKSFLRFSSGLKTQVGSLPQARLTITQGDALVLTGV
jgi:hypothetical protein